MPPKTKNANASVAPEHGEIPAQTQLRAKGSTAYPAAVIDGGWLRSLCGTGIFGSSGRIGRSDV
jgi:hypothetical protein